MKLTKEQTRLVKRWISLYWSIENFMRDELYFEEEEDFDLDKAQKEFHEIEEILGLYE